MTRLVFAFALAAGVSVVALKMSASTSRGCPDDRPCILAIYNSGRNLVVEWNDTEGRDHYNVRWSRPGREPEQIERPGGRGGNFVLRNFRISERYTFSVQGCRKPLIGRSVCTAWYEETVTGLRYTLESVPVTLPYQVKNVRMMNPAICARVVRSFGQNLPPPQPLVTPSSLIFWT